MTSLQREVRKALDFAAAYLEQSMLDRAEGRHALADFYMEQRKDYQRRLAALRNGSN